jgi:hypothetical protein
VLVFKQKFCSCFIWGRLASFFSVFHWQLFCQFLPQWGVACPQVPDISSVAPQPSCFGVGFSLCLFIVGLFLCLASFLWGKVRDLSVSSLLSACYAGLLVVFQFCNIIWLWILLTVLGDDLYGPLSAPFQVITHLLLALLSFQSLFTESSHGDQLVVPPPFPGVLTAPCPFCLMFLFSSLFIVQCFFCCCCGAREVSLSSRLCWFIPGVAVGILPAAYLLTCWSAECLQSKFGAIVWWHESPPVFSVQHGIQKPCMNYGFRVSKFWFFLGLFFCQVWLQHLSKIFDLQSSHCLLLHSSHYLVSSKKLETTQKQLNEFKDSFIKLQSATKEIIKKEIKKKYKIWRRSLTNMESLEKENQTETLEIKSS